MMKYLSLKNRLIYKYFLVFFLIYYSTQHVKAQAYYCGLDDTVVAAIWIGQQTIDSGKAHTGSYISLTNDMFYYGLGMEMPFPDTIKGKNTQVTVSGWVTASAAAPNALYVVTARQNGRECFWQGVRLDTLIKEKDHWYRFEGTYKFPASVTRSGAFKCYLWNAGKTDTVAIDDLEVNFNPVNNPSFLPQGLSETGEIKVQDIEEVLFVNPFYELRKNSRTNGVVITSKNGNVLLKEIISEDAYTFKGNSIKERSPFVFQKIKSGNGTTKIILTAKNGYATKRLSLICRDDTPEIACMAEEKYRKKILCHRSSIVIESGKEVKEVLRSNRKTDAEYFQEEYWLAKEGVRFGEGKNSLVLYHAPKVSSLQLDTKNNCLVINLDYEKDHPFLHFPLDNDTTDYKVDLSAGIYKKGDKRTSTWKIFAGMATESIPRLMKNPSGYMATYIWTEHADFSDIRTNRAAYYGSEKINRPEGAMGGFVKYGIPVTKSVFYDNPDRITNAKVSDSAFTGLECAILTDTAFRGFLDQIKDYQTEICLHTPEQYTTTPAQLEGALRFTKKQYGSVSWIDHGYNNHLQNNREDLMCDGLLKKSPYYAAGLWKKYGVKYFWNAYYEDYFTFAGWKFGSSIEPYYAGYGDFMPKPDYWRHPTRSGQFIHWPTSTVLYINRDEMWDYFFNEQNLNDFVDDWSVEMNHCYPGWTDPQKGFWTYGIDSVIVAQPGFNRTLERMVLLKQERRLNVTTVKDFLDYQLLLENILYELLPDGRVKITNQNNLGIRGLALAVKAKTVLVDRLKPAQKMAGDDLIFWFDIKAGETKIIRVIE